MVRDSLATALALAATLLSMSSVFAQVSLGTAQNFGVLAGSAITNTGPTTVTGDVGVSPGTAVTGFPPGLVAPPGTIHSADAVALQAQTDLGNAYVAITSLPAPVDLTGSDLGGLTLTPGVYQFSSSAQLTGTLTLDAQGDPNASFIFRIGSTLTTASGSSVAVINGGSNCNVFWQVGSSATLGTTTAFVGNILALTSITMNTGATLAGRALARNGAVTLASNSISPCATSAGTCPALTLTPSTLPAPTLGATYAQNVVASGAGATPYTYSLSVGSLPVGLSLNASTGAISGVPSTAGNFGFTLAATDSNGCVASRAYTLAVAAPVVVATAVPTLSVWNLMFLVILTGAVGVYASKRKETRR